MKVSIYLKHIVIPIVVITITLGVIFIDSFITPSTSQFRVSFLFSSNNVSTQSTEQIIYNSLKQVQETYEETYITDDDEKYSELLNVDYTRSSSKGDAQAKLDLQISSSDILFIYGSEYDDYLESAISENPKKIFYIIENDKDFSGTNVSNIDIDYDYIYEDAFKDMKANSQTQKILFVSTVKEKNNDYYSEIFVDDKYEISYAYIKDSENNSEISDTINKYLDEGYDQVYVDDITLNDYVISIINNYQGLIVEEDKRIITVNEELTELKNSDNTLDEEQQQTANEKITELEEQLTDKYVQSYIDVYLVGYDYSTEGLYIDAEGVENSNVKTSYVIDPYEQFYAQINQIINKNYSSSTIVLKVNKGIRKVENED